MTILNSRLTFIHLLLISIFLIFFNASLSAQDTCSFQIDLGPDINLDLGQSFQLDLAVSVPMSAIDTISWTPSMGLSCTDCYEPIVTASEDICYTAMVTDTAGCIESDTICIFVQATAIHSLDLTKKIDLFPNPTNDFISLVSEDYQVTEIKIYDATGKQVEIISEPNNHIQIIQVSNLIPGVYYLQVKLGKYFARKQFVKF